MAELSKAIARLMEERERAQPQAVLVDAPKLRDVLEAVRSKLTPAERPLAEAFVRQLFDKSGTDVLMDADRRLPRSHANGGFPLRCRAHAGGAAGPPLRSGSQP